VETKRKKRKEKRTAVNAYILFLSLRLFSVEGQRLSTLFRNLSDSEHIHYNRAECNSGDGTSILCLVSWPTQKDENEVIKEKRGKKKRNDQRNNKSFGWKDSGGKDA
jgi:hypothetical protein